MSEIHSFEREEVMAYLDGELPAARAAEVAAHVERCTECRQFAADIGGVSQRLATWQVEPADMGMPARIASTLRELPTKPRKNRWAVRFGWGFGVAACVAVLGLVLVLPRRYHARPLWQPQPVSRMPKGSAPEIRPMVERRAQLALTAADLDRARATLETIIHRHNSYTGALTVNSTNGTARTLDAILRVPANQLDTVLKELKSLGRVVEESQTGEEVTQQYVDLEARLANARNTENRLTGLLRDRTGRLSDVLEVERELSRVRGEVEQMEAERKNLSNLVEYAIVNVRLTEERRAETGTIRFRNAAAEGYRIAAGGVSAAVVLLFSYGPILAIWVGVLFFPVRFVWKKKFSSSARP